MKEFEYDLETSITVVNNILIVALAGEMTDAQIDAISDSVAAKAYTIKINGAILNFSMVSVVDTYTFKAFEKVTRVLALMGVRVIWVGLRPGVVSALMDLDANIVFSGVCSAVNLDQGLMMLSTTASNKKR